MEKNIWENISSKYLLKNVFSYLKVHLALKVIKKSKKIRETLEISLFHYQYYYFCILHKTIIIEKIGDILNSPYITKFPEKIRFELILKFIQSKKLFNDEYIYLKNEKKNGINFFEKLQEKNYDINFKYLIGDIENEKKYEYKGSILNAINLDKNCLNKILFDYSLYAEKKMDINLQDIKYLYLDLVLNNDKKPKDVYDLSLFDNLEYLFLSLFYNSGYYSPYDNSIKKLFNPDGKYKIILLEKQYKNIKTLKIKDSENISFCLIKNIIFECEENKNKNIFENLKELHVKEKLLSKIKINLNKNSIQKLNILYDYREENYETETLQESINNIIDEYPNLKNLNITFYYRSNSNSNLMNNFIQEMADFIFNLNQKKLDNISLEFNDLCFIYTDKNGFTHCSKYLNCLIKNIPNKKSKYIIKGYHIPFYIFSSYLDKIEEIYLSGYNDRWRKCSLFIEENNLISSLTKIRINFSEDKILNIPIKSFSSLNILHLEITNITLKNEFPLFSNKSQVKFLNLEHLMIDSSLSTYIILNLTENFNNIPNLKYLGIINTNICNTVFPYHKDIINKCCLSLKKLHTLIIYHNKSYKTNLLNDAYQYYPIYPELKNTNIIFCLFSELFNNK